MKSESIHGWMREFFGGMLSLGKYQIGFTSILLHECAVTLLKQDCCRVERALWSML